MATLVVHKQGGPPSYLPLVKPLTTLADADDADLRVPEMRGVVALQLEGSTCTATALEGAHLVVNGKKRGQHALADGDTMQLGATQIVFQGIDKPPPRWRCASCAIRPRWRRRSWRSSRANWRRSRASIRR